MAKDRFSDNPYPDVQVSDDDRRVLIDLVSGFVDDNFQEFDEFVEIDQQIVDERRWKLAKSRDNQHVEQATGYNVHKRFKSISSTTSSQTDISENSSFLEAIMEESDEDEDIPLLSDLSPSEAIPMVF
ncbi:hypothetical protein PR002_g3891 [Phytophthora rubi]|uniref:Uncharacterized protein n=1 Tax=Phytophthora rubi TaxID=129364 RepID=A0A6A3NLJ1_9STRA|nr:hypothetical protein PR002_g3891 [Phytophthora rubi]